MRWTIGSVGGEQTFASRHTNGSSAQGRDLCTVSGERQHGTRDRPNLSGETLPLLAFWL